MSRAKPVDDWLADGATPAQLKQRLALAQQMRDFSVQVLKLPDNPSYRAYADLQRPAAVWNVVAAPALSLTLKTWCYPVTGCVGYRGYFDRAEADALGAQLRAEGWDVNVYGVPAYSTLGWSNWIGGDPLLNTFVNGSEGELARLIFHELAHQQLYVADDTMFNESFATAVERIGTRLWLEQHGSEATRAQYRDIQQRRQDFRELTMRWRDKLRAAVRQPACPTTQKRAAKAELLAQLRADYAQMKQQRWGGFAGYDAWFASVNNASLGVLAAYNELVADFERLFEQQGRDFERFYAEAARIGRLAEGAAPRHTTRHSIDSGSRPRGGHPHSSRTPARPAQGAQGGLAMGRGRGEELRHGMHRDRRRLQRHHRVHALRRQGHADRRGRPLRPECQARLPARRLQPHHRKRDRAQPRQAADRQRQEGAGEEGAGEEGAPKARRRRSTSATRSGPRSPASRRSWPCP